MLCGVRLCCAFMHVVYDMCCVTCGVTCAVTAAVLTWSYFPCIYMIEELCFTERVSLNLKLFKLFEPLRV